MSYIKRDDNPLLIVCDYCGKQRDVQYAITHRTHRAIQDGGVRHYCTACADVVDVTCA